MTEKKVKENPESASAKRNIWTMEPDEDVKQMVDEYLKANPGKKRTDVINDALREKFPVAAANSLEAGASKLEDEVKKMRDRAAALRKKAGGSR